MNLKLLALLFLIVAVFGLYPTSVLTMEHGLTTMNQEMTGMIHTVSHSVPIQAAQNCINYHIGLMNNLTESTPPLTTALALLFLVSIFLIVQFSSILHLLQIFFDNLRVQYKRLRKKSLAAFIAQLGFWLNIIQKKSPAFAFAPA